jgi:ActR/RegA family two-component response regulator
MDRRENSALRGIAVAILTEHQEQQLPIQNRVEATGVARIVFSHPAFPLSATDSIIRQIQDQRTEVVVVDLHPENLQRALDAIALIQDTTSDIVIFAIGEISNPTNIVAAMRAGACEYVDRQAGNEYWLDAFARFAAARTKKHARTRKTRVFTVINAKWGSGATTVAVNTAVALQRNHGQTVLIDFAPIGHAALHLNLQPSFGILDALQNLHRMDTTLLDGMMTPAGDSACSPGHSNRRRQRLRPPNWRGCFISWSAIIATWWLIVPAGVTTPPDYSQTSPIRCCWWHKRT